MLARFKRLSKRYPNEQCLAPMLKKLPLTGKYYLYLPVKSARFHGPFQSDGRRRPLGGCQRHLNRKQQLASADPSIPLLAVSKVGESILLRRLKEVIDALDALPEFKFEFGKGTQRPSSSFA
jgi:hypothetical protein